MPGAHGKGYFPHGKIFAVCCSRQTTHGKQTSAKGTFAECFSSRTRQKFCRVLKLALGKHFPKTKKFVGPTSPLPHAGTSSSPPSERPLRCRRGPRPVARASSAAGVAAAAPARGVPPLLPPAGRRCCRYPPAVAAAATRRRWPAAVALLTSHRRI